MSGATIDYDALAAQHGGKPAAIDYDALAAEHGGTAAPQHDWSSLTQNPKGEGTYKISTPDGQTLAVPYSNVPVFQGFRGASFASPGEQARFDKDAAADPHRPTFWNALTNPVGSGGAEQGVVGGAEQVGGQAIKTMAQPVLHPVDTLEGMGKLALETIPGASVVLPNSWNPVEGEAAQLEQDYRQGGVPLAAENAAGQAAGTVEGGRVLPSAAGDLLARSRAAFNAAQGGLRSAGQSLAESALGIRNVDRAFDAAPGHAALTETQGNSMATIEAEARQRLADLVAQRQALAQANPGPVDLGAARRVASDAMQEQVQRNAMPQVNRMAPLAEQLRIQGEPSEGWPVGVRPVRAPGAPIPRTVLTPEALDLREGVGNYAADRPWTGKASADPLRGMVRNVYGSVSDAIHNAVPEIEPIDARMHDLIPVANRSAEVDLNAPTLQRIAGRFARHTGALTSAVGSAFEGGRLAGAPGAIAGGAMGLAVPEVLAMPEVQMAIARALYRAGGGPGAEAEVAPAAAAAAGPASSAGFYSPLFLRSKAAFEATRAAEKGKK